jgi:DNA excision repair protein ERCC-2
MENLFPYQFRHGQKELIDFISNFLKGRNKNALIQAASGFGKTVTILSAILPEVKKGKRVIWAVKTGNEADRPIEELKEINKQDGRLFGFSFRGKRDMCLLIKNRENVDYGDAHLICKIKRERGQCPFYENMKHFDCDVLEGPLLYSEIIKVCKEIGVCPYLAQSHLLKRADLISLSYNYIIQDDISHAIKRFVPFESTIAVIDEAHNLQGYLNSINGITITESSIENSISELRKYGSRDEEEFMLELLDKISKVKRDLEKKKKKEVEIAIAADSSMIRKIISTGIEIKKEKIMKNKVPRSSCYRVGLFLESSARAQAGTFTMARIEEKRNELCLEFFDMRTNILAQRWRDFDKVIFCSGTLEPIADFEKLIGIDSERNERIAIPSPYTSENIFCGIISGLTTKGEEIGKQMIERYLGCTEQFIDNDRNLAIFVSSYRVEKELLDGLIELFKRYGKGYFIEYEGMSGVEGREILEGFKRSRNSVLVASLQGRFAEGADFPSEQLEGIFIVGIPFDKLNLRARKYIGYCQEIFGKDGRAIAYTIPAIRRTSQAIGRGLRSTKDRVFVLLGDERYRYREYFRLLPDFVRENCVQISQWQIREKMQKFFKNSKDE